LTFSDINKKNQLFKTRTCLTL